MTEPGSSCGACKFLRRKCTSECVFSPYFCYCQAADHFAAVHKVFGASNVSKLLMKLPLQNRSEAAISITYEALARMHDPIYGCVAQIFALEQQVASLQEEIDQLGNYMANAAFGLPYYASFHEINYPNTELPFSFWCNHTSILDHLNQQAPPLLAAEITSTPQAFCNPTREPFPSLHIWEGQISHSYSFLDHPLMENGFNILNK